VGRSKIQAQVTINYSNDNNVNDLFERTNIT
jgi:hypothetical protein